MFSELDNFISFVLDFTSFSTVFQSYQPGRVAQPVGHLTRKSEVLWPRTFVSPSADSRGAVVSYWRKYLHEVLVNRLGVLSLSRKSVVKLTGRPDMTVYVYRGRKTTIKQQQISHIRSDGRVIMKEYCNGTLFS